LAQSGNSPAVAPAPLELAVIVPTFNEARNVRALVDKLRAVLGDIGWEIVFVDDNSPDGTSDVVRELGRADRAVRVVQRVGRRGLSSAVVEGMLATSAPVLAVMDGDLQHDEAVLPEMFRKVAAGECDVAIGTRYSEGGSTGDWSADREAKSRLATRLARLVLKTDIADPMSGFFVVDRRTFEAALPRLSNVGFKILMDLVASLPSPPRVAETPYTFRERVEGESKLDAKVMQEFAVLLLDKMFGGFLPVRFLMFAFVGALGLAVHLTVLGTAFRIAQLSFQLSQSVAVVTAMTFNYVLNNSLTYRDMRLKGWGFLRGLLTFYLVCGVGAVGNVGVATLIYKWGNFWWLAGVAGAAVGVVWNFSTSAAFTWKRK
jgi:dolichol-phosphate mannosyltransferase